MLAKPNPPRTIALVFAVIAFGLGLFLLVPDAYERAAWHVQRAYVNFWHTVNPDSQIVPTSAAANTVSPAILTPVAATSASPAAPALNPTATPPPIPTPPAESQLTGFTHTWQKINNCGPATLAMNLTFWGWKGTQANTAAALKPDPNDRNVSPHEMADYARNIGLGAEVRVGGTLELIKRLVAAGFPVILEKGIILEDAGWEGHYILVTGYSDAVNNFTTQDSLQGPNFQVPYYLLTQSWRAFNYTYIVIYPSIRQDEVLALLGPDADPQTNYVTAANMARKDIAALGGQDLAFAWFNLGANLASLGDAQNAAAAFDQARIQQLPWRMVWYQFSPLEAYYAAGRYSDVVALADSILGQASNIEEAHYWRGRARLALGDQAGAMADWRDALRYNRNYPAPALALAELGLSP